MKNKQERTLTDPCMKRFLMNLADSLALVEYALASRNNGSIFVWKAPAVTMQQLLGAVCERKGAKPTFCKIIGRRPGEKIHETLVCEDELYRAVDKGQYVEILPHGKLIKSGALKEPFSTMNARQPSTEEIEQMLIKAEQDMESIL